MDFGLPLDWSATESWLNSAAAHPAHPIPAAKEWSKKVPEILSLTKYSSNPDSSFWDNWPTRQIPDGPQTKINIDLLNSMFLDFLPVLPGQVIPWGKKVLKSVLEGAQAHQVEHLPPVICPNNKSLIEAGERVTDELASGIKKGFIAGPFSKPPLKEFRSNTMNAIKQKDKIRLVMDLSRPEGKCYNSNLLPNSSRSVSMSSPRLFSFSLLESGPGAVMSKHDWTDAYKNIPVMSKDLRLQGFSWMGKSFVELSLVFGSVNSVEEFDNLGELFLSLVCAISKFPRNLTHRTLDDVPVVSPKDSGLTEKFSSVYKQLCKELNIELAPDCPQSVKAFTNQTSGTVLGFKFNSITLSWAFSEDKADDILRRITVFLGMFKSYLLPLQELAGCLENFGSMSPFTKAFRLPLYGFIRKFKSNEKIQLIIPNSVKSDLAVWSNVIQYSKKGLPIAPRPSLPPIYAIRCTSDAAGVDLTLSPNETEGERFGAASILHTRDHISLLISRIFWPPHFIFHAKDNKGTRIAAKSSTLEAIGVLLPFLSFPEILAGKHVILQVDNLSLIHGWKKRQMNNDLEASMILRAIHVLSLFLRCRVHLAHCPRLTTPSAVLADHLSRKSSTSTKEELLARTKSCPPNSPALQRWLQNPTVDWNLPLALLEE